MDLPICPGLLSLLTSPLVIFLSGDSSSLKFKQLNLLALTPYNKEFEQLSMKLQSIFEINLYWHILAGELEI